MELRVKKDCKLSSYDYVLPEGHGAGTPRDGGAHSSRIRRESAPRIRSPTPGRGPLIKRYHCISGFFFFTCKQTGATLKLRRHVFTMILKQIIYFLVCSAYFRQKSANAVKPRCVDCHVIICYRRPCFVLGTFIMLKSSFLR